MSKSIVVWKEKQGQLVSTMRTPEGEVVTRDTDSLKESGYTFAEDEKTLLAVLDKADGSRVIVPVNVARDVLGWDVA